MSNDLVDNTTLRTTVLDLLAQDSDLPMAADGAAGSSGQLEITSLELIRLLVRVEEYLGVEFDDAEIMNAQIDTVDDIVELIRRSLAGSA